MEPKNSLDQIRECLHRTFRVLHLELLDDSQKHKGHAGSKHSGGGHYRLLIISSDFEGKPLLDRHREVFAALNSLQTEIHALSINPLTPAEAKLRRICLP